jgi:undecaprenyl-diphosphatase
MTILQAIILSIVEGITEFLPISSTGHLIIASQLLGIPQTEVTKSFEIIIQLGAIMAIALLYGRRLFKEKTLWIPTLVAFLPTALVGLLLYSFIKTYLLGSIWIVVGSLLLGGIAILLVEYWYNKQKETSKNITTGQSFGIGVFQSLSVIPGVSRSGATILGAMLLGTDRTTAVEFSFFLSLPTMLAATTLDIAKSYHLFSSADILTITIGFLGSFLTALIVIKTFLRFVKHHTFISFGIYRILLSILLTILLLSGVIS